MGMHIQLYCQLKALVNRITEPTYTEYNIMLLRSSNQDKIFTCTKTKLKLACAKTRTKTKIYYCTKTTLVHTWRIHIM